MCAAQVLPEVAEVQACMGTHAHWLTQSGQSDTTQTHITVPSASNLQQHGLCMLHD